MVVLNENTLTEYEKNGAVCLRNVFDTKWIASVAKGIEKNMLSPSPYGEKLKGDQGSGFYFDDYCNWKKIPEFYDYVLNSPAAGIACVLMQSKYASFYHEHVLVKEPGTYKETPWHHDQSYYPIDGNKVCSIWMPVDYVPKDTCVKFVAGSHKENWYFPRKFATDLPYEVTKKQSEDKNFIPVPSISESKENILCWELHPGDCIVFHMRTLHGAPGNLSSTRTRRILSTRWLGDDAVIAERPWETSPPTYGGLKPGDKAISEEFPLIYTK